MNESGLESLNAGTIVTGYRPHKGFFSLIFVVRL